jgi:glycosyltransferase involved in cell wall biosynthesis
MRVLLVHNSYQQYGGEDTVVSAEMNMLRANGHEVVLYARHNDDLVSMSAAQKGVSVFWSSRTVSDIENLFRDWMPDVAHVHNTLALVSPSIYWVLKRHSVPIVQTLHNFRLVCPQAMLMRSGRVCTDCVGRFPIGSIVNKCYRQSSVQSAVLVGSLWGHRAIGTWHNVVDRYIALSSCGRDVFIRGGLPADKISVKPNFVSAPLEYIKGVTRSGGAFVGRLVEEKGVLVLLDAIRSGGVPAPYIIGNGELAGEVRALVGDFFLGSLPRAKVLEVLSARSYLLVPSVAYEPFGLVAIEAFSLGVPVIASRVGALPSIVVDGVNGLLFNPGDAEDLANKILWAERNPDSMRAMGENARNAYLELYAENKNYELLMQIYGRAIEEAARKVG